MLLNNKKCLWKLACGLVCLVFSFTAYADSDPIIISSDAHLTGPSSQYADQDVVVDGATLTLDGEHHFRSLHLTNQAIITHSVGEPLHLIISESLLIDEGAAFDATSRGELGPSSTSRHGGSHGGAGGERPLDDTFGDFEKPTDLGLARSSRTRGGGAIRITAEALSLNGAIVSDGQQSGHLYGGGSGGSVWLTVGELSGSGRIAANGGPGGPSTTGSGGGGGRVALYYEINNGFDPLNIEARGGVSTSNSRSDGGAGSIYFKDTTNDTSRLIFSGSGTDDALSLFSGPVPNGTTIEVVNTRVVLDNVDADESQDGAWAGADRHIRVDGGYLSFRPVSNEGLSSRWETVTLENEAVVSHSGISSDDASTHTGLHWSVGQLTIDEDSSIDVSGRGRAGTISTSRHGGSHGGAGGERPLDETFGDFEQPADFGLARTSRTRGGGIIRITAEALSLNGAIVSDGQQSGHLYGGGSGGSVWLTVGELSGSGRIAANGGPGGPGTTGSGGGGGRVALYYDVNIGFDPLNIEARGGEATGSYSDGGVGSIYFKDTTNDTSKLIFSDSGSEDTLSLLRGPISDGTTIEVINTRVVLDNVDADDSQEGDFVGADRHIRVDDGYLSFRPVSNEGLSSRWETVTLENEAVVSHSAISSDDASTHTGLHWSVGQLTIDEDSSIDVSGRGRAGTLSTSRHGGSHGGAGGERPLDETFGDFEQPTDFGLARTSRTRGGGIIRITAEALSLNGAIVSDGQQSGHLYGGGSGGSIWLTVGELSGSGRIAANGGPGGPGTTGAGGGGGRVALYYEINQNFSLPNITALGGLATGSYENGSDGTVHIVQNEPMAYIYHTNLPEISNAELTEFTVDFSVPMDAETFLVSDVIVQSDSSGALVTPAAINKIADTRYSIEFEIPVSEGSYLLTIGPNIYTLGGALMDQNQNGVDGEADDAFVFDFVIDTQAPEAVSLDLPQAPEINTSTSRSYTLTGSRDDSTSVWVNGNQEAPLGSGPWSADLSLSEGENTIEVVARDAAGNLSEPVTAIIDVDSIAPTVVSRSPSSYIASVPEYISVQFRELGSGLDFESSDIVVRRDNRSVLGSIELEEDELRFYPQIPFPEGSYSFSPVLIDQYGNQSADRNYTFTIDYTPPDPLVLNDHPGVTSINSHQFSGEKEAGTRVYINGERVPGSSSATTWSREVPLEFGENQITFFLRDQAGNDSEPVTATIVYNDQAPGPVPVAVNPEGSGEELHLSWSGYDEYENGNDIEAYYIHLATGPYDSVDLGSAHKQIPGGTQSARLGGLELDTEYHVSVVAVNTQGLYENSVSPVAATPLDVEPPENVSNLQVVSGEAQLQLSWQASANTQGDLEAYVVSYQLNGERQDVSLSPAEVETNGSASHTLTGLNPAAAHEIQVTAVDHTGNASAGATDPGVTLLANPSNLEADGFGARANLTWTPSEPQSLVEHYAIYVQSDDFNSVSGMSPRVKVPRSSGTQEQMARSVAGLTEGETVYVAVTAVNLSNGENPQVSAVSVVPEEDTDGPEIEQVAYNQSGEILDLSGTPTLSQSGQLMVKASDRSGVSRVTLSINGEPLATITQTSSGYYRHQLDLLNLEDGEHSLTVEAYDSLDNKSEQVLSLVVSLAPPASPAITQPSADDTTNRETLSLAGTSVSGSKVRVLNNGAIVLEEVAVNRRGEFGAVLTLEEGDNIFTAQASYPGRSDWSADSNARTLVLNTEIPDPPRGVTARSRAQGEVQVSWNEASSRNSDNPIAGYNLYRSVSAFSSTDNANVEKVNGQLITRTSHTDLVVVDGDYIYAVTAVNEAGNESGPSTNVEATADSSGPKITEVHYEPLGNYDASTGRMAPGDVRVEALFDQPLRNDPYFAIVPEGGSPILVDLRKGRDSETRYTGQFRISESTPSGTAYVVMSAYDEAGNRGTEVLQGDTLEIDSDGPDLVELLLSPGDPLKVDSAEGLEVTVSVRLSDDVKPGTVPNLVPVLDQEPLPGYEDGINLHADFVPGEDLPRWLGSFDLPQTAGRDSSGEPTVEQLTFAYVAYDDLDNSSTRIHGDRNFQVYQGDLPPLSVPANLSAQAKPKGKVQLSWGEIDGAHAYVLYRQGPQDEELLELETVQETEWLDATDVDGDYLYAVASVRRENQQESTSAQSDAVSVTTRRVAPAAPENLELELDGAGIISRWDESILDEQGNAQPQDGLTYNLYRLALAEGDQVTTTEGLTPIQTEIPEPIALDTEPEEGEHSYFVTAVDAAGNESVPSTTQYLNFGLLPVRNLSVVLNEEQHPVLSWHHDGEAISHYLVYRDYGSSDDAELLTEEPINHNASNTEYLDESYTIGSDLNTEVRYTVVAVDSFDAESLGHTISLPPLSVTLDDESTTLDRGVMNKVSFRVDNRGNNEVTGVRLYATLDDNGSERVHQSDVFSVEPGAFTRVPVVIGGYDGLDGIADLQLRLEQVPQTNSTVQIHHSSSLLVDDAVLSVDLNTEDFIRGGTGLVRFSLENTSDVEAEILMAESEGANASPDVRLALEDLEGNVLATQPVKQYSGDVITLSNRQTVARVAPGESFQSAAIEMPIPAAAPDRVRLRIVIDRFHYHSGRDTHVAIKGAGSRTDLTLTETPYYVEVTQIAPDTLYGAGKTATIEGRAIRRSDGTPQRNVPVRLAFNVRGFERTSIVYTDGDGNFSYDYRSEASAGSYRVSAVHPSVQDRPDHGRIQVIGADVSPRELDVRIPRNYTQEIPIRISAGHESTLTNVRLTPESPDGVSIPQLPIGVNVSHSPISQIDEKSSAYINIKFSGDNSANRTGTLRYRVEADNFTGDNALGVVSLDYTLSEARPAIGAKPTYIDTGVGLEDSVSETIELTNSGLDTLSNAEVELVDAEGNPPPSWIRVLNSPALGDMAIGDSRSVQLRAEPDEQTSEGNHEFALKVTGDNLNTFTVPVFVAVTQSGVGDAFFHVSDIYTATLDENDQLIPGLQGAKIELQNEQVLTETFSLNTNALGEATFEGIPAGRYSYRATAFDHGSKSGRIWIKPGVTTAENVFLVNSLVTVEWSVREITVEDRYEIKLEATYETNVPVAVVVFDPMSVQLPVMEQGDVFQGELTLTNHGLIRATDVKQSVPEYNNMANIEFLRTVPDTLEPGEVFTLPYRIRALRDFNPEADPMATGGGCGTFNMGTRVNYRSECVNGEVVASHTSARWDSNWGRCTTPSVRRPTRRTTGTRNDSQPQGNGSIRMVNRGGWANEEPLWCKFVTECEDDNCDNASAK